MTDKQLKLIYEYMGWDKPNAYLPESCQEKRNLNSNSAWECVQEMERKKEFRFFYYETKANYMRDVSHGWLDEYYFVYWLMNPTNFFSCMGSWLEEREVRK